MLMIQIPKSKNESNDKKVLQDLDPLEMGSARLNQNTSQLKVMKMTDKASILS